MNKKIVLGLVAIAILVLVGFNLLSNKNSDEQALSSLDVIKENGVIRIGTEGTYAPFTFYNDKNELTGFDVEIAREVAKRIGVEAEFIETKWDGMFAGLDSKRFDFVANQVTIKADRIEKYDFSTPYIKTRAVLVVHADNNTITSFEDLKGKKSGQSLTSNLAELATSYGAEIVQIDGFNQAIDLLLSERIDATINDRLSFLDFKVARPDAAIKVVAEEATSSEAAFLFNKGNEELVAAVNKALEDMKSDGTYLEISERWFGDDVSK